MTGFDSNDPRDEALWRLLGRARPVEPSPYFARRVRHALEPASSPTLGWRAFFQRLLGPTAVCAGLVAVACLGARQDAASDAVARADMEFETIQNLDLLVSNYESSLWLDPSSSPR